MWALVLVCGVRGCSGGASAYHLLGDVADELDTEGAIVEVGSDRGEGSTRCVRFGKKVYWVTYVCGSVRPNVSRAHPDTGSCTHTPPQLHVRTRAASCQVLRTGRAGHFFR